VNAQNLLGLGAGYSQQAAQIQNPYQTQSQQQLQGTEAGLNNLAGAYQAYGNNTAASNAMYNQGQGQAMANAMAQAGGARGPNVGGAQLAAQGGAGTAGAGAAGAAGTQQAQQQQFGMGGQAGAYGQAGGLQLNEYALEQKSAEEQAQLQLQNQQQQNAMQMGLYGLGQQAQGQQLSGLNSYTSGLLGAQGIQQGGMNATNALGGQAAAAAGNGLATGLQYGAMQGGGGGGGVGGLDPGTAGDYAQGLNYLG
jgi:hypothetical protein